MSSIPQNIITEAMFISARQRSAVVLGLFCAMCLAALDQSILSTALPMISSQLGSLEELTWIVTAFMLTSTVSTPLYGKLSDVYGRKCLFAWAAVIFLIASTLCTVAASMSQLVAFRALQGLGAGGLLTLTQILVSSIVPIDQRSRYQGIFVAAFAVSSVIGPILGGFLTSYLSWRWIFFINVPLGLIALMLVSLNLPTLTPDTERRVDYRGGVLMLAASTTLLLALDGSGLGWGMRAFLFVIGVVILFLFKRVERNVSEPIVDLSQFRVPAYRAAVLVSGMMVFAMMSTLLFIPMYCQIVLGQTLVQSGTLILPQVAMMMLAAMIGGRIAKRPEHIAMAFVIAVGVQCVGLSLVTYGAWSGNSSSVLYVAMGIMGAGLGLAMSNGNLLAQNAVAEQDLGSATATLTFVRSLGGSLGMAAAGGLVSLIVSQQSGGGPTAAKVKELLDRGGELSLASGDYSIVLDAYQHALTLSFALSAAVMLVAFTSVLYLLKRNNVS